ncbi:T6SS immunity protein Tdi1 domain-containing protein [Clostridium estertheticum]|uniref:DUF1851 domain-containing protein n=1 Tax=Clostridium estertheticum subsp. estertheticum TaxID=1552 RepID=A0A1J0GI48_9CLOT|nr:T6SS immunity protein Tdi1 domain-containing protein [Clostridium estertheticum]APC40574.1 hypothetical protein A7L45_11080 [Clostridium estertheticum subsp. estertheticum]MBU3174274.1 DUF1851 domain-containing protein [Clostridium estertheticum]MBW9154793.1 DUF1851 domain-containing protein [Clostridium estertheticum]MBZ9617603.1 DUF1851 domain-containing protein [Clostridium estertheticum subsp. laramiense]MCB2343364.1 DUF1851 domain-containing protein [Clostridium estertheticum]
MSKDIFDDFILEKKASEDIIAKYTGKVPKELLYVWNKYGFGTILNGYLKIINPEEIQEILEEVYTRNQQAIPLFTTAMGDIIVWEKERYLNLLNFRKKVVSVISAGFDFFLDDLGDVSFLDEELNWKPYSEAVIKYGKPAFDECFGYVPLLGLGGPEKVKNLEMVKFIEHIYLITQFMGQIE